MNTSPIPKPVFIALSLNLFFVATLLSSCGDDSKKTTTADSSQTVTWNDIKPTVAAKCGGSTCHSSGSSGRVALVENEANMKSNASLAATYIRSTSNPMPPSSSSALTTTEKSQILSYLDAQK